MAQGKVTTKELQRSELRQVCNTLGLITGDERALAYNVESTSIQVKFYHHGIRYVATITRDDWRK